MYPLKFKPVYKEKIWGGPELAKFRESTPPGNFGESWEISCHPEGVNEVANGEYAGMKFDDLLKIKAKEILGTSLEKEGFQLLVKIINSNDKLSIQVHPDDNYAREIESEKNGKNEIWYVLDTRDDAELVIGFDNCDKDTFIEKLKYGNVEECFKRKKVKKGDVYFVKSGLVHAINKGILLVEIQQSSDLTYRIYDYGRGRELHIDKALDVIDYELQSPLITGKLHKMQDREILRYFKGSNFTIEKVRTEMGFEDESDESRYHVFVCIEGECDIAYNGNEIEKMKKGESVLIPASLGKYRIIGNVEFIKAYV